MTETFQLVVPLAAPAGGSHGHDFLLANGGEGYCRFCAVEKGTVASGWPCGSDVPMATLTYEDNRIFPTAIKVHGLMREQDHTDLIELCAAADNVAFTPGPEYEERLQDLIRSLRLVLGRITYE